MRRASLTIMLFLTLSAITLFNTTAHQRQLIATPSVVKSQSTNTTAIVSIIPENVSDLSKVPGSTVVFNVTLASSPSISAFAVWVQFDPKILEASSTAISYTGNVLGSSAQVVSECINGASFVGVCQPYPLAGQGVVNLGMFLLGGQTTTFPTNGLLYQITLKVLKFGFSQIHISQSILTNGVKVENYPATNVDGQFANQLCGTIFCTHPFVDFTFSPPQPSIGSTVTFNASASRATNANARLSTYTWFWGFSFGSNSLQVVRFPIITHVFGQSQEYAITLTVNDTLGISWSVTRTLQVVYLFIDVGIVDLSVAPSTMVPVGTLVNIVAVVENNSTIPETANATIMAGSHLIGTTTFVNMSPRSEQSFAGNWDTNGFAPGRYTVEASVAPVTGANITSNNVKTVSMQLIQSADKPPVAKFIFSPTNPVVGQQVLFDGSASYDPDGTIQLWTWDFGDHNGVSINPTPISSIVFLQLANYTVTLTVTDNAGLTASTSAQITIRPQPLHDVSIVSAIAEPKTVVSSQSVNIQIVLRNDGLENETVTLTVLDGNTVIQSEIGVFLHACPPNVFNGFCYNQNYANIRWDTTGIAAGNYTISANVSISPREIDPTPSDNSLTGGTVTVLLPPIIDVTPNSGIDGTRVQITGSGFPTFLQNQFGSTGPIFVTFDNMNLGYAYNVRNGSFTFTFDVPESQPGMHQVNALDVNTGAHSSTIFTVLPTPTNGLVVTVNAGSVYFPGDTAIMYTLTTFNGIPVEPSNVQLRVSLYWPNGTVVSLSSTSVSMGLFKTTFAIPKNGPLGTYFALIKAHESGPVDASALVSFEVKLPWLSSNSGRMTVGAAALAGVFALVAISWKKRLRTTEGRLGPSDHTAL